MNKGHVVYELIIAVLVVAAVMIAYMKFSGKPLIERADTAEVEVPTDITTPETPVEPQPSIVEPVQRFLESEAFTVFAYSSYHSTLPLASFPPDSAYPQISLTRDDAALRPQGEEELLVHNGVYTGYIPAAALTDSSDLCATLAQPTKLSIRVCGTGASCVDGETGQDNHRGVAFVLFNPEESSNVYYSATSGAVSVKNIDIADVRETSEYTIYGDNVLVVTAEQLARAAGCF